MARSLAEAPKAIGFHLSSGSIPAVSVARFEHKDFDERISASQ